VILTITFTSLQLTPSTVLIWSLSCSTHQNAPAESQHDRLNWPFNDLEDKRLTSRVITRRFTYQLTGSNTLEQLTKAGQAESDKEEEELEVHQRLRLLIEGPEQSGKFVGTRIFQFSWTKSDCKSTTGLKILMSQKSPEQNYGN